MARKQHLEISGSLNAGPVHANGAQANGAQANGAQANGAQANGAQARACEQWATADGDARDLQIARLQARVAQLEEALRVSQAAGVDLEHPGVLLRQIVDALPVSLYVKDRHLRKLLSNPIDVAYMGVACEEDALGCTDEAIYSPEEAAHFRAQDERVLRGEHLVNHEEQITVNGERRWLLTSKAPLYDANGAVIGLVGLGRDITDLKQARDELAQLNRTLEERVAERTAELAEANALLEQAARLKDEFLANMSHELRTPLTGVLGMTEALQAQTYGPLNEQQMRLLGRVGDSGRHLLEIINDILDLSKLDAGRLDLNIAACDVESIGRACLEIVRSAATAKGQSMRFEVRPSPLCMQADPRRLRQMLINLLSNAVKFTPEGGSLGLTVCGDEDERVVRFTVWDNGIGIAAEDQAKLFQPFVQLDGGLARRHNGTGLGLVLVRRMAELHGGHVGMESTVGQGSRFTIRLPWK